MRHVELRVSSRSQGDYVVLALVGEIDLYTAPRLQSELTSALSDGKPTQIVVDMSGVEFCDSTGMNVLLAAHRAATERGGQLALAAPRPSVRKILEVTGLQSVFTIHDDGDITAGWHAPILECPAAGPQARRGWSSATDR